MGNFGRQAGGVLRCLCVHLCLALMLGVTGGVLAAPAPDSPPLYRFGVLAQRTPTLTAQYWNPLLEYVGQQVGVRLELQIARTVADSNLVIGAANYDFVYSNTIFDPALSGAGYQVILRPRHAAVMAQIVVTKDSPLRHLSELQGREVGFPAAGSFLGFAVPMDHLQRQKIRVRPVFGGNQEGVMAQLRLGRLDAIAVNSQLLQDYARREGFAYRVLWSSLPYHNLPVAVHPRVPAEVVQAVRQAFVRMADDPAGARLLEASARLIGQQPPYGFFPATTADYRSYLDFYRQRLPLEPLPDK